MIEELGKALRRAGRESEPDTCGDCRELIRPACQCEEHVRICCEQQRADEAERLVKELRAKLAAFEGERHGGFTAGLKWSAEIAERQAELCANPNPDVAGAYKYVGVLIRTIIEADRKGEG